MTGVVTRVSIRTGNNFGLFSFVGTSVSKGAGTGVSAGADGLVGDAIAGALLASCVSVTDASGGVHRFRGSNICTPRGSVSVCEVCDSCLGVMPGRRVPVSLRKLGGTLLNRHKCCRVLLGNRGRPSYILEFGVGTFGGSCDLTSLSGVGLSCFNIGMKRYAGRRLSLRGRFRVEPSAGAPGIGRVMAKRAEGSSAGFLSMCSVMLTKIVDVRWDGRVL